MCPCPLDSHRWYTGRGSSLDATEDLLMAKCSRALAFLHEKTGSMARAVQHRDAHAVGASGIAHANSHIERGRAEITAIVAMYNMARKALIGLKGGRTVKPLWN
ncbi:hypothetical protein DFH09DRAFT_1084151 [Mycena vulgaris]|nr:hypothetical protein DFH09DRAFT_1084151 [Mycena vulgaris]